MTTPAANATGMLSRHEELGRLLEDVGLPRDVNGGEVEFVGEDPMLPTRMRAAAICGVASGLGPVIAAGIHRQRTGVGQAVRVDAHRAVAELSVITALRRAGDLKAGRTVGGWDWLELFEDRLRLPTISGQLIGTPDQDAHASALAGEYRTADGRAMEFTCTHPWMRDQVAKLLDVNPHDRGSVAAAVRRWDAEELEQAIADVGGAAAYVRSMDEWNTVEQSKWLAAEPLISIERIGDSDPEPLPAADRPLAGVRAVGQVRVIAGPVMGNSLAQHGADVINIRHPGRAESTAGHLTGLGMRHAYVDHHEPEDRRALRELMSGADIWFANARPGADARHGLSPEDLAELRPGIIHVSLNCYGHTGPWSSRAGYVPQAMAATGVVAMESSVEHPVMPPVGPLNDFVAGWFGAAGAMAALHRRAVEGGSYRVRISLARCGLWYLGMGLFPEAPSLESLPRLPGCPQFEAETPLGHLVGPEPIATLSRTPARYDPIVVVPQGSSRLEWIGPEGPHPLQRSILR